MKYNFYSDEYHSGRLGESTDNFAEWLSGTSTDFFVCEEESEYFTYTDSILIDSYLDYKRGYEKTLILVQNNETKEYYGFEHTGYHHGESFSTPWEKYDRVKTRPVVYKYRKAS